MHWLPRGSRRETDSSEAVHLCHFYVTDMMRIIRRDGRCSADSAIVQDLASSVADSATRLAGIGRWRHPAGGDKLSTASRLDAGGLRLSRGFTASACCGLASAGAGGARFRLMKPCKVDGSRMIYRHAARADRGV